MGRTHGGYGKDSKTYRIWDSGTKIVESRNVTFIETFPVRLNAFDRDHNDGNDDTFLDLESSSISLGTQEMPETEADAEPDTGDSHSGGTIMTSTRKVIAILTVDQAKRLKQNELHAS